MFHVFVESEREPELALGNHSRYFEQTEPGSIIADICITTSSTRFARQFLDRQEQGIFAFELLIHS